MKFLIVLSVLVVCATAKPFFFKHPLLSGLLGGGGGGSSSNAAAGSSSFSAPAEPVFVPAPPPPEPFHAPEPAPVSSGPSGGGHGGLGGLGNLIMIPLNIKKSLLQAHQAKFNKKIQQILGAFSKLGGGLGGGGGGSSSNSIATGNSFSGPEHVPVGPPAPPPPPISYPPPIQPAPVSGLSGGSVDYNALGAGESSFSSSGSSSFSSGGSGLSTGGNVQTYHPQPAPETNYHKEPIVLYLYPVDQSSSHASSGSSSVNFQPAPIAPRPDCNQPAPFVPQPQPAPFIPQPQPAPFIPEPAPFVPEPFVPEPIAPQQTYGPPDYQPAQPISNSYSSGTASSSSFDFEPQVVQPVPQPPNTYLPPSYKRRY